MCCEHLRSLSESEKRLCSIADTEAINFPELVRRLPNNTFLDLTTQTDVPGDAWEEDLTGWDHEAHEIPAVAVLFWPHQPGATSRLPDLVPASRPVRTEDEMSVQEHETTHVPFTHPSASETSPSGVPVTSVDPEDSVQTTVHESHYVQTSCKSVRPCGTSETYQR